MKMFLLPCILLSALSASAQTANPLSDALRQRYAPAKQNLIESAELMPEEHYTYKLSPAQRSFGEWMEHNVSMNYGMCSAVLGVKAPADGHVDKTAPKSVIIAKLKESFAFCDPLFAEITDASMAVEVTAGSRKLLKGNQAIGLLINWNEHYGNIVGYLRTKGLVPPSSARAAAAMKK
jgi:hypothetical protein